MVSHVSFSPAVQAQLPAVLTDTVPDATPPAGTGFGVGWDTVNEQAWPGWVTVYACPAIVIVPVRVPGFGFASTEYATVPGPFPDVPFVMVIHGSDSTAVQPQLAPALTVTLPTPASAEGSVWLVGLIEKLHGWGPCVIVAVCPPTRIVPVRAAPGFAAVLNVTLPLPVPDAAPVIVIQGALAVAVQAHDAVVVTVISPGPPPGGVDCVAGASA
jgi:hypothetical protein